MNTELKGTITTGQPVCVHVVKEHLGFYTLPEITEVREGEDLNDVMLRVLTEEWHWTQDVVKDMCEEDKIRCFCIDPNFTKVWEVVKAFLIELNSSRASEKECELKISLCEAHKVEEE